MVDIKPLAHQISEPFIRVALLGASSAGKSTLVVALTKFLNDNGLGSARQKILNSKSELKNGFTSTVIEELLGFDINGNVVIPGMSEAYSNKMEWKEVWEKSSKFLVLIDTCGLEKFQNKTISGISAYYPDYAIITIAANEKITNATKYMFYCMILKIPFFIVLSKLDITAEETLKETLHNIGQILSKKFERKYILLDDATKSEGSLSKFLDFFYSGAICPIFLTSSVTSLNLEALRSFLGLLKTRITPSMIKNETRFFMGIVNILETKRSGRIFHGVVCNSSVKKGERVLIGPCGKEGFCFADITDIEIFKTKVDEIFFGQTGTLALKSEDVDINQIKNFKPGIFITKPIFKLTPTPSFNAILEIFPCSCSIKVGFRAIIHTGPLESSIEIVKILKKEVLRSGDKAEVEMKFEFGEEIVWKNQIFLLREGSVRAAGMITSVT